MTLSGRVASKLPSWLLVSVGRARVLYAVDTKAAEQEEKFRPRGIFIIITTLAPSKKYEANIPILPILPMAFLTFASKSCRPLPRGQ